jgi:hypothetical protein
MTDGCKSFFCTIAVVCNGTDQVRDRKTMSKLWPLNGRGYAKEPNQHGILLALEWSGFDMSKLKNILAGPIPTREERREIIRQAAKAQDPVLL